MSASLWTERASAVNRGHTATSSGRTWSSAPTSRSGSGSAPSSSWRREPRRRSAPEGAAGGGRGVAAAADNEGDGSSARRQLGGPVCRGRLRAGGQGGDLGRREDPVVD